MNRSCDTVLGPPSLLGVAPGGDGDRDRKTGAGERSLVRRDERLLGQDDDAVAHLEAAVERFRALPDKMPNCSSRYDEHWQLGLLFEALYEGGAGAAHANSALCHAQVCLQGMPRDHRRLASRYHHFAVFCANIRPEDSTVLFSDTYLELSRKAVDASSPDHPLHSVRLWTLGAAYMQRYETAGGRFTDLEHSIRHHREAVETFPVTEGGDPGSGPLQHESRSRQLVSLAYCHHARYIARREVRDVDLFVAYLEAAMDALKGAPGEESLSAVSGQLRQASRVYLNRFHFSGTLLDIDRTIEQCTDALRRPDGRMSQSDLLSELGGYHLSRYQRTGTMADLQSAIRLREEALRQEEDASDSLQARRLYEVASCTFYRYSRSKQLDDLGTCISYLQEAVDRVPAGSPAHLDYRYSLGVYLNLRYFRSEAMADLERCIVHLQKVVDICPEDDPSRWTYLDGLGSAYMSRYMRTQALPDLDLGIQWSSEAVDCIPEGHGSRVTHLLNLSRNLSDRYSLTHASSDLDRALELSHQALGTLPDGHPDYAGALWQAGCIRYNIAQTTTAVSDLDAAIQLLQRAIDLTPRDGANAISNYSARSQRLDTLAGAYSDKFSMTGRTADADAAVLWYREALDLTPEDEAFRGVILHSLHLVHRQRHACTGLAADLESAVACAQEAFRHRPSSEEDLVARGIDLFDLFSSARDWTAAYDTAQQVMSMIPQLTPRSLGNLDRQILLRGIVGFASGAATAALLANRSASEAVQLLEHGRAVLIGSMSELRTDASGLQRDYPVLAEVFLALREQLDGPITHAAVTADRDSLAARFEDVLADIRTRPGYECFLGPPSEDAIKAAATRGPIVMINEGDSCHALIIQPHAIQSLPLPRLSYKDIVSQHAAARSGSCQDDESLLEWLWDVIAEPVLTCLGINEAPPEGQPWPRIWWIPTGSLVRFPIHAAGRHRGHGYGTSDTVLDRVISSYSSSIKTLLYSRQASEEEEGGEATRNAMKQATAVLVGMPSTPGHSSLPFVARETGRVASLCGDLQLQAIQPRTRRQEVLDAMGSCTVFHFAGHGRNHASDPSRSALMLSDGPLTVADLFEEKNLHRRRPFLAHLSACGTGQVRHTESMDEGLHLISACQLAGFRHVVGSLYEIEDESSKAFAALVYEWAKQHGMSDRSVCEGVHDASRRLRDRWVSESVARDDGRRSRKEMEDAPRGVREATASHDARDIVACDDETGPPLYWAPYVHFGG